MAVKQKVEQERNLYKSQSYDKPFMMSIKQCTEPPYVTKSGYKLTIKRSALILVRQYVESTQIPTTPRVQTMLQIRSLLNKNTSDQKFITISFIPRNNDKF